MRSVLQDGVVTANAVVYFRILRLGANYDSDTVLFDLTTWSPTHAIIIIKMDLQNQQDTNMPSAISSSRPPHPLIIITISLRSEISPVEWAGNDTADVDHTKTIAPLPNHSQYRLYQPPPFEFYIYDVSNLDEALVETFSLIALSPDQ